MHDLNWYLPLQACTTLDEIALQWPELLEGQRMAPSCEPPAYEDALLAFIGGAPLSPHLKLSALLAFGSAFDFDLRLALGALAEQTWEADVPWPESVAAAVADNGPALTVDSRDEGLAAFVLGRLAGLRETLVHDGKRLEHWHAAFWNRYLAMGCRHGTAGPVALALRNGADPLAQDQAAVTAAAAGPGIDEDTPARQAVDEGILVQLLDATKARDGAMAAALRAAAAADRTAMLDFLLRQGANARDAGALAAAARHLASHAFERLLAQGADASDPQVLLAAVASLDETMVEAALAAGADARRDACAALCAAFEAQPWDLYGGEPDFVRPRADILALLLREGARCMDAAVVDALAGTCQAGEVVRVLLEHEDLDADSAAFIGALALAAGLHEGAAA